MLLGLRRFAIILSFGLSSVILPISDIASGDNGGKVRVRIFPRTIVSLGQKFIYQAELELEAGCRLHIPSLRYLGVARVIDNQSDHVRGKHRVKLTLAIYRAPRFGKHHLPSLSVEIEEPTGKRHSRQLASVVIELREEYAGKSKFDRRGDAPKVAASLSDLARVSIKSSMGESETKQVWLAHDWKAIPLAPLPDVSDRLWYWQTILLGSVILIIVLLMILIRWHLAKTKVSDISEDPYQIALQKIAALSLPQPFKFSELRTHYVTGIEILREYIQACFRMAIRHLTLRELPSALIDLTQAISGQISLSQRQNLTFDTLSEQIKREHARLNQILSADYPELSGINPQAQVGIAWLSTLHIILRDSEQICYSLASPHDANISEFPAHLRQLIEQLESLRISDTQQSPQNG